MIKSAILSLALLSSSPTYQDRMNLAEYSFITGCYSGVKIGCKTHYFELQYLNCLKEAFPNCENNGKEFRKFIENGKKK